MSSEIALLEKRLSFCLRRDQHRLRRILERIKADAKAGRDVAGELAGLQARVDASVALCAARAASVPPLEYPDLPVSEKKNEILAAIRAHQVVIVCGETGSGKTTQLPKICLEAGRRQTAPDRWWPR
jgi:ATP-dependent helicase HrpA